MQSAVVAEVKSSDRDHLSYQITPSRKRNLQAEYLYVRISDRRCVFNPIRCTNTQEGDHCTGVLMFVMVAYMSMLSDTLAPNQKDHAWEVPCFPIPFA